MDQKHSPVALFDKYRLVIPPKLKWHQEGIPGQRVFLICDEKETAEISFEEGMKLMDMTPDTAKGVPTVSYQCCRDGKYIHQRRGAAEDTVCSYFHMELEDDDGKQHCLAGQLLVKKGYPWTDGVEPVLMDLMDGIQFIPS